jgi:hypothetical protein
MAKLDGLRLGDDGKMLCTAEDVYSYCASE